MNNRCNFIYRKTSDHDNDDNDNVSSSSTDGSISLLGDHEFMSDNDGMQSIPVIPITSTAISTTVASAIITSQPEQLWMRCQQPELTLILRKTSINFAHDDDKYSEIEATTDDDCGKITSTTSNTTIVAEPTSTELVLSPAMEPNASNKVYQTFSVNTILLLITGFTLALFAVICSWYAAPVENINELKHKIYRLQLENGNLNYELGQCRLSLSRPQHTYPCMEPMDKYDSAGDRALTADNDSDIDDIHNENNVVMGISGDGERVESSHSNEHSKTVWTGEGKTLKTVNLSTEKHFKYEHLCDENIHDDLFSAYITDYCKAIKKKKEKLNSDKKGAKRPVHTHENPTEQLKAIEKALDEIPDLQEKTTKQPDSQDKSKNQIDFHEELEDFKEKLVLVNQYDLPRPLLEREQFTKEDEIVPEKPKLINQYDLPRPPSKQKEETVQQKPKLVNAYDLLRPQFKDEDELIQEKPKLVNQYDLPRQQHTQRKSKKGKSKKSGYDNTEKISPAKHDDFEIKADFLDPNQINYNMRQMDVDDFDFDYSQEDILLKDPLYQKMNYDQYYMDDDYRKVFDSDEEFDDGSTGSSFSLEAESCYSDEKYGDNEDCIGVTLSRKEQKKLKKKLRKEEKERIWEKKEKKQSRKEKKPYKTYDD